eukprot:Gb_12130 [translate_table: standard]
MDREEASWWLWGLFKADGVISVLLLVFHTCLCAPGIGDIHPEFRGSQMNWIDYGGILLYSANKTFGLGLFNPAEDKAFFLSIKHLNSAMIVWTANRDSPVSNSDPFEFSADGNAGLTSNGNIVWSSKTGGKGVKVMELQESGNLVLLDNSSQIIWQSFDHPTDTLLFNQSLKVGMKLVSNAGTEDPSSGTYFLNLEYGDLVLYANYNPPQPYWTMQTDVRRTILRDGILTSAVLSSRYWGLYDETQGLLEEFIFSYTPAVDGLRAAVLGPDGNITFHFISAVGSSIIDQMSIPEDFCQRPNPCGSYSICNGNKQCQCPQVLSSMYGSTCNPPPPPTCNPQPLPQHGSYNHSLELVKIGDGLNYFANQFVSPVKAPGLIGCQQACKKNCSCIVMFFSNWSGDCFLYGQLGSLQQSEDASFGFVAYIKVLSNSINGPDRGVSTDSSRKHFPYVVIIALSTVIIIVTLISLAYWLHRQWTVVEVLNGSSEDEGFLENLAGLPIRFSYRDLQTATNNFNMKLGQGGFGPVYEGVLPDGSKIAVKQLESIGQGNKEFHSEVSIIGNIHHVHLVRLRGFCADRLHRLLVYDYMANGSLDKSLFNDEENSVSLNWEQRYNIALGTAKGLAYLHEECSVKVIHCDIKPENILLDENYTAKVSDFGLAKLISREHSHVFTTLRGTRGYLAPEWLTNSAISDKSDVYSFGMVLLEIIGGRKNFVPTEASEKCHFPAYAFKQLQEGKLKEILDAKLDYNADDERLLRTVRVALWCIQEDAALRPSMVKVVQMLEGVMDVAQPPASYQFGFRLHTNMLKSLSAEEVSLDPSDYNSQGLLSAVCLSEPSCAGAAVSGYEQGCTICKLLLLFGLIPLESQSLLNVSAAGGGQRNLCNYDTEHSIKHVLKFII